MQIPVIDPKQPFQADYQPAVIDLVKFFKAGLRDNLHSIYIYGSVARKTAHYDQSNLDVVIVTHRSFGDNRATLINTLRWRFQKSYPFINGIDIQTPLVKEVATLDSLFSWGFLLHHCAVCIYGDNLGDCFGDFEPSWEIAKHWNMDIADWSRYYRDKLAKSATPTDQAAVQKVIAKKLLRASYSLVMYRDKNWYDDPLECGMQFLRYHPDKQVEIDRLAILLSGRVIPKRSVIALLDSFSAWLDEQYKKTEFRIG
jgi:predicted nucleotidyltransferase